MPSIGGAARRSFLSAAARYVTLGQRSRLRPSTRGDADGNRQEDHVEVICAEARVVYVLQRAHLREARAVDDETGRSSRSTMESATCGARCYKLGGISRSLR
jgi:hypothetical protein